jgi:hypothetical protein
MVSKHAVLFHLLYKQFPFQPITQTGGAPYHQKKDTYPTATTKGIETPAETTTAKGQMPEKFYEHHKTPKGNKSTAEHKGQSFFQITAKGNYRRNQQGNPAKTGENKGQKPLATCHQVNQQKQSHGGGKIKGNKNNGIGLLKPPRQKNNHVNKKHTANGISRPTENMVDLQITKQEHTANCQPQTSNHGHKSF